MQLDVRLQHEVTKLTENSTGWLVSRKNNSGTHEEQFDYVIISNGQYTQRKVRPSFENEPSFEGRTAA